MSDPTTPSATDRLIEANRSYVESFDRGDLEAPPSTGVAVVACMDARIDVHRILGLREGEAHVIRNAGGVVTDEVIRSLAISQHKLGTTEVIVIGHTRCGLEGLDGDALAEQLDAEARAPRELDDRRFRRRGPERGRRGGPDQGEPLPQARPQRARLRLRRDHGRPQRDQLTPESAGSPIRS